MSFNVVGGGGVKDWLDGCVPWNGKEEFLPTGTLMPPKVQILRLMKSWEALREDGEIVSGLKMPRGAEDRGKPEYLMSSDIIIGAEPNNAAIRALMRLYGKDAFWFIDAYGHKFRPDQWVRRYKTNPFAVLAIMRISRGIK